MSDPSGPRRLAYEPALDGLRGLAVAAVLLYHSELSWARGGFLAVSTFFTLSGFLICSLLLAEHSSEGHVDLRAFWGRRFRRLMPAAVLGLAGALLFGATIADGGQMSALRSDILGALGYVANWRFVLAGDSYGDLFAGGPSPVLHYWSLAIEEQFYVVFPLLVVLILRVRVRTRDLLVRTFATLSIASIAASLFLVGDGSNVDRVYFGTDTRAVELLLGALFAVWWHHARSDERSRATRLATVAAPVVLVLVAVCWMTVEQASLWLYQGGLALYAVGSAVIILGAIAPGGPVRALLSAEPLRQLGRYSYGVYVYHWPVFLWINPERYELQGVALLGARLAVTAALALASFHLVEQPVRMRQLLSGRAALVTGVAAVLLVGLVALRPLGDTTPAIAFESALETYEQRPTDTVPVVPSESTAVPTERPSVAFYGDSTALMTGLGFADWLRTVEVFGERGGGSTQLGCGFTGATPRRYRGTEILTKEECDTTLQTWEASLSSVTPEICVVMSGMWNVDDRKLDGIDEWVAPGHERYDNHLRTQMRAAAATFEEQGCVSVWVLLPYSVSGTVDGVQPREQYSENDPARWDHLNEMITRVVSEFPDSAALVDLPAWMDTLPGGQLNTDLRPDLVHFGWEDGTAARVAREFLGRAVYDAYRSVVGDEVAPPLPPEAFIPAEEPAAVAG